MNKLTTKLISALMVSVMTFASVSVYAAPPLAVGNAANAPITESEIRKLTAGDINKIAESKDPGACAIFIIWTTVGCASGLLPICLGMIGFTIVVCLSSSNAECSSEARTLKQLADSPTKDKKAIMEQLNNMKKVCPVPSKADVEKILSK